MDFSLFPFYAIIKLTWVCYESVKLSDIVMLQLFFFPFFNHCFKFNLVLVYLLLLSFDKLLFIFLIKNSGFSLW